MFDIKHFLSLYPAPEKFQIRRLHLAIEKVQRERVPEHLWLEHFIDSGKLAYQVLCGLALMGDKPNAAYQHSAEMSKIVTDNLIAYKARIDAGEFVVNPVDGED